RPPEGQSPVQSPQMLATDWVDTRAADDLFQPRPAHLEGIVLDISRQRRIADAKTVAVSVQAARSQLIIQGIPNRSTSMPKRTAQKVSWSAMRTAPPSASASKIRCASLGSATLSDTEKPFGCS